MKRLSLAFLAILVAFPAHAQSTLYSNSTGVGIGTTSPAVALDASQKTDAIALPVGTTGHARQGRQA